MELDTLLLNTPDGGTDLAILIGRLAIGVCFIIHGLGKLGIVGSGNMKGFVAWLRDLGVPMPEIQARMAMLSEIGGGALLAVGLLTRPAAALLMFTMIVAGIVGHRGAGYLITNDPPGSEYTINLAVICLVLGILGPGAYSLDTMLFG
ncbi:MAG: DoxX family protein [Myxococcota bacterium]